MNYSLITECYKNITQKSTDKPCNYPSKSNKPKFDAIDNEMIFQVYKMIVIKSVL